MRCGAGDFRGEDRIKRGSISAGPKLEALGAPRAPEVAESGGEPAVPDRMAGGTRFLPVCRELKTRCLPYTRGMTDSLRTS